MNVRNLLLTVAAILCAATITAAVDYDNDPTFIALRDSMHESFNNADEARFAKDIKKLEDYLWAKGDMHAYYTQRCNEIVFMMNGQKVFEAYKAARKLSQELQDRKLDKEMYMAYNMLGHIYRYCGNEEGAKRCFLKVIEMMEEAGYRESLPPIYMNIVGVFEEREPEKALELLEKAHDIAMETSPMRVFDIDTRRTLIYYNMGEHQKFLDGYKAYKEGVAEGKSSVHGRLLEVYYTASQGNVDEAVQLAREELGEESYSTIARLYKDAGRWEEAYYALQKETKMNDSINSIILTNSIDGMRSELKVYDMERKADRMRTITLSVIILLLVLFVAALIYIMLSRRRHMHQLKHAYQHALESDKMKTAFIKNVSHEVRTPLNIISGFTQVIANPTLSPGKEERKEIAKMIQKSTRTITRLIDEMLELSINESAGNVKLEPDVDVCDLLSDVLQENTSFVSTDVKLVFDNNLPSGFTMTTNKEMLRRAVNVLLDNAVKYTSKGTITLRAAADEIQLVIAVEDTGCGIPAEDADRIFERFFKLDKFKEGIGLGLPLGRTIASRLRGSLVYDKSYKGPGSRFVLSLPL